MANIKNAAANSKKPAPNSGTGQGSNQLEKYLTDLLNDIYWAEKTLVKALPKMRKASTTVELQDAIEEHIAQTEEYVNRLERV